MLERTKILFLFLLLSVNAWGSDPMFAPGFTEIKNQFETAKKKREEISKNFENLKSLLAKNMALDLEISSIMQELSKAPEFGFELEAIRSKSIEVDIARAKSINDGYGSINKEIEERWKTAK